MKAKISPSRIARAMGDDEMVALLCDDRPDLVEQLRANNALAPRDQPSVKEAIWLWWGALAAVLLIVLLAYFGVV